MIQKTILYLFMLLLFAGVSVHGDIIGEPKNQGPGQDILTGIHEGKTAPIVIYQTSYDQPDSNQSKIIPAEIILAPPNKSGSEGPRLFIPSWEERNNPEPSPYQSLLISPLLQMLLSVGISLVILILVTVAGLRIGASYQYEACEKTRKWIGVGQVACTLLIIISVWLIFTTQYNNARTDPYFLSTLYAFLGVQVYLAVSSLIQAISIFKDRPIPPVYHIHILFVFIAISLVLMSRVPFFPPLPTSILAISIFFLPGAVLSLMTSQIIRRTADIGGFDPSLTLTRNQSIIHTEITSSFPEALRMRYQDVSIIGSGGVAVVYRAVRVRDGKLVALKIPFSPDEASGKTFLNEMAVWRELHHPSIVSIYDQNIFPIPYVEMEYMSRSLRDVTYPVAPDRAISIIGDIASALLYAHGKGVIHRDIKPGNVLLNGEGRAKLADWGLSRSLHRAEDTKNTSFSLFYATPEQLAPDMYGSGDQRTDIYQLGVLLYELLCGEPPYVKPGIGEIFIAIQKNQYRLPSECTESLRRFDPLIKKALKADPAERFESIEEFIACLEITSNNGR
ncbi:MAG TPA: serine/threonine-protein kinase [Methanospirillum sp.]|uniref:serine/threonine protein kinase n=1 Tax=Methanospirillum sp. TaxID=45200 RepID=UPI002C03828E|nr:serine/threonine-protein kinase [Methanospirillum sp.]HWQ65046.1 serine/threonine-protein kinase [Methanospirillum sp.]